MATIPGTQQLLQVGREMEAGKRVGFDILTYIRKLFQLDAHNLYSCTSSRALSLSNILQTAGAAMEDGVILLLSLRGRETIGVVTVAGQMAVETRSVCCAHFESSYTLFLSSIYILTICILL